MLVHIIHVLIRARTRYTCARAHPRKNAHAQYMTQSSAHAETCMPGTCGLTMHAHTPPRLNTRACMRTHTRCARTQAHSCTHPHNAHACIRTNMHEHTSTCARTRATTYIFGCALTDWGHTPQLWFVFRKTLSLFGCLALFVLHSHGVVSGCNWWLWLGGLTGWCLWEWGRSLRPPAGRAMPYIKLLPLPPPCGSYWPVGGFQQCRLCVLSCCCSLSVALRLQCRVVVL